MSKFTDNLFIHQLIKSFINQKHFAIESHNQTKINFCPLSVFNELIYELIKKMLSLKKECKIEIRNLMQRPYIHSTKIDAQSLSSLKSVL